MVLNCDNLLVCPNQMSSNDLNLTRKEKRQLRQQGYTRQEIRDLEKKISQKELNDLQEQKTNEILDRFDTKTNTMTQALELKHDVAHNRAMNTVLDSYGINKINKNRIMYLVNAGVYKRNPDTQRFDVVRLPNTNSERRKLKNFNVRARKNSCKTLDTMYTYDQENGDRIENENKSYYLAWKNKRLQQEPKYKDLIRTIGYVPTIDRDDIVNQGLNPEQVILQMKEELENNARYYEAVKELEVLQKQYGVGLESRMTGTGYQGTSVANTSGSGGTNNPTSPTAGVRSTLKNCGIMGTVNNLLNHTNATPGQKGFMNTAVQMAVVGGGIYAGWTFLKSLRKGNGWIAGTKADSPWTNRAITIASALGIYAGTSMAFGRNPFQAFNDIVFGGPTTQKIGQFVNQVANAGSQASSELLQSAQSNVQREYTQAIKADREVSSTVIGPLWAGMMLEDMTIKDLVQEGILIDQNNTLVCSVDALEQYAEKCLTQTPNSQLYLRGQRIKGFVQDAKDRYGSDDQAIADMLIAGLSGMGIGLATIKDNKSIEYDAKTISKYYTNHNTVMSQLNTYLQDRGLQTKDGVTATQLQKALETMIRDGQLSDLDIEGLIKQGILEPRAGRTWKLNPIYQIEDQYLSQKDKIMLNVAQNEVNKQLGLDNKINDQITFEYDKTNNKLYLSRDRVQIQIRQEKDGLWYFGTFPRGYKLPEHATQFILGANLTSKIINIYQGKGEQKPYFQYSNVRTGADIEFNKKKALDQEVVGGGIRSNLSQMMPMINSHLNEYVSMLNNMPYFDPEYNSSRPIRVDASEGNSLAQSDSGYSQTNKESNLTQSDINHHQSNTEQTNTITTIDQQNKDHAQYIQNMFGIKNIINPKSASELGHIKISQPTTDAITKIHQDPAFECKDDRQGAILNGSDTDFSKISTKECTPAEYKACLAIIQKVLRMYPTDMFRGLENLVIQKDFLINGKEVGLGGFYILGSNSLVVNRGQASKDIKNFEAILHHELSHFIHEYNTTKNNGDLYEDQKKDYNIRKATQDPDLYCDVTDLLIVPSKQKFNNLDKNQDNQIDGIAETYGGTAIREDIATMADGLISNTESMHVLLTRARTDHVLRHKIELMTGCRLGDDPANTSRLTFASQLTTVDRNKLGFDEKGAFYYEWSRGQMDFNYRKRLESGNRILYGSDYTIPQYSSNSTESSTLDHEDQVLKNISRLEDKDIAQLVQARKTINEQLGYTNHIGNNIKFVCQGDILLIQGAHMPLKLHKEANGKRKLENYPRRFGTNELSQALGLANLTGYFIKELNNKGAISKPREVSSNLDVNSINGYDLEFNHKDSRFTWDNMETTAQTGGRRGGLKKRGPNLDNYEEKERYVQWLNTMPYRQNYSEELSNSGLGLTTDNVASGGSDTTESAESGTSSWSLDTGSSTEVYNEINADKSDREEILNNLITTNPLAKKTISTISDTNITKQFELFNDKLFHTRSCLSYIKEGDFVKIKYKKTTLDLPLGTIEECMRMINLIDYSIDYIKKQSIPLYDLKIGTKENVGIVQAARNGGGNIEGYLYRPRDVARGILKHDIIIAPQDIVEAAGLGAKTNDQLINDPAIRREVDNVLNFMKAFRAILQTEMLQK